MARASEGRLLVALGRPRGTSKLYSEEVAAEIIDRMSSGATLTSICSTTREGVLRVVGEFPSYSMVKAWTRGENCPSPDFVARFARARLDQLEYWNEEIVDIARTPEMGEEEIASISEKDGRSIRRVRKDMLHHRALKIDTLLKAQARLRPDLYLERLQAPVADTNTQTDTKVVIEGGLPDDDMLPPPTPDAETP